MKVKHPNIIKSSICITIVILLVATGFIGSIYRTKAKIYQKLPGLYVSNIDSYSYTPEADMKYIREHGAAAHEYFANRPQYYQRFVKISSSDDHTTFDIVAYAANDKGNDYSIEFKSTKASIPIKDLLKYQYQDEPIAITFLDGKKNVCTMFIDDKKFNQPGFIVSAHNLDDVSHNVGKYLSAYGVNISHQHYREKADSDDIESLKSVVKNNIENYIQERNAQADKAFNNLMEYYQQ